MKYSLKELNVASDIIRAALVELNQVGYITYPE